MVALFITKSIKYRLYFKTNTVAQYLNFPAKIAKWCLTFFREVQMLHCCHAHSKGFNIFLIRFEVEGFLWKRKKRLMAFAFLRGYKENLYLEGWIVTLLDNFRLLSLHFLHKRWYKGFFLMVYTLFQNWFLVQKVRIKSVTFFQNLRNLNCELLVFGPKKEFWNSVY